MREIAHIFIVGGQRSGTSFLMNLLNQHSKIQFTKLKTPEPRAFFDTTLAISEYRKRYFELPAVGIEYFAEKSTSYYERWESLRRINGLRVEKKIIFIVRNPVDRALSNFKFSVDNGLETRSLRAVFLDEVTPPQLSKEISVSPFDYIKRGFVYDTLIELEHMFGDELICLSFSDLTNSTHGVVRKLFSKLGLEHESIFHNVGRNQSSSVINDPFFLEVEGHLNQLYRTEIENLKSFGINV